MHDAFLRIREPAVDRNVFLKNQQTIGRVQDQESYAVTAVVGLASRDLKLD